LPGRIALDLHIFFIVFFIVVFRMIPIFVINGVPGFFNVIIRCFAGFFAEIVLIRVIIGIDIEQLSFNRRAKLRFTLYVDLPARKLGRQPGILPFFPYRQRQLVVRNNNNRAFFLLIDNNPYNLCRA
jgi:hypothetical protein